MDRCQKKTCDSNKVCNPASGRCVLKTGAKGKEVLGNSNKPLSNVSRTQDGIWDAFFSEGIGLNLAPRLPKVNFGVWQNPQISYPGWENTARFWAGATPEQWRNVRLGRDLASDQFSRWLRSGKDQKEHMPGFERYENALMRDFKKSSGIDGYAIVFRGMPNPPASGLLDKSPMSVTKRLAVAQEYASRYSSWDPNQNPNFRPRIGKKPVGSVVVALLLPPGTKLLPLGGEDAEYLLPPGTITPVPGRPAKKITRVETNSGSSNVNYITRLSDYYYYKGQGNRFLRMINRPNTSQIKVTVLPALFTPDKAWNDV